MEVACTYTIGVAGELFNWLKATTDNGLAEGCFTRQDWVYSSSRCKSFGARGSRDILRIRDEYVE